MRKSHSFVIPGKPVPKGRPRMTRRGRVYTPKRTLDYEQLVRDSYGDGPKFDKPVRLDIEFTPDHTEVTVTEQLFSSPLRADLDNLVKAVGDGLNGAAYNDDRQVVVIYAAKS